MSVLVSPLVFFPRALGRRRPSRYCPTAPGFILFYFTGAFHS
jgi:hypothetical protein